MSEPSNTAQASTDAGAGQAAADQGKQGAGAPASVLSAAGAAEPKADAAATGTDPAKSDPAEAKPKEGEGKDGKEGEAKVPEKYELKMPEGMTLDEAALGEATPVFKELGLTGEQAQKLADVYAKQVQKLAAQSAETWKKQHEGWVKSMVGDAEFGGDGKLAVKDGKLAGASSDLIGRAINKVGGEQAHAFKEMLDMTGAGNHPEMARFLYRVGKMVGEGSVVRGDAAAPAGNSLPQEVLYPSMKKGS
jgi:hypothetical protein